MQRSVIQRYLHIRAATSPSLSPDGRKIAFLTNISGHNQVWTVPAQGGWPDQVTFGGRRALFAAYSPVATELAVGTDEGGNERQQLDVLSEAGQHVISVPKPPEAICQFGAWSADGSKLSYSSNQRRADAYDIYVRDLEDAEARLLLETDGSAEPVAWSPDGTKVLVRRSLAPMAHELLAVDVVSGDPAVITPSLAYYGSAVYRRDGRLYVVTDYESDTQYPARFGPDGTLERLPGDLEWDTEEIVPLAGDCVAWTTNRNGTSTLTIFDETTHAIRTAGGLPEGVISGLTTNRTGRLLVFALSAPRHPSDIWTVDSVSGEVRQVTHSFLAGVGQESFRTPALIRYPTFDKRRIPAWFYEPAGGADRTTPCVIDVHGGPESQRRAGFDWLTQYYLSRGYAVLAPNVRGSTGYGKAYSHLDDVTLRMDSVRDLEYAVRWLKRSGRVDSRRIAVTGGSYGGFMVLAALTTYPDLWAAGVELCGIANLVSFLENTGPWRRKLRIAEYGDPEKDRDFLTGISPVHHVDRIAAPLMVIHGANDPRVPVDEAEQIVQSLRERGRTVEYLRLEDEGHGIAKLENKALAYQAVVDFLDRHLRT